jgi:hypothetical protein
MEDILGRAKSLGIQFEKKDQKVLDRQLALQDLLEEAECQRVSLEEAGVDTTPQDKLVKKIREEINDLSRRAR